jgi:predicted nuclease of predicted toxin-antitoxin system
LDEHIHPAIAEGLDREEIDVTTTVSAGLRTADDHDHLVHAINEKRVLVTQDHGFLQVGRQGVQHYGIVYCKQHSRTIGEILTSLIDLWREGDPEQMRNRIEYVKRKS